MQQVPLLPGERVRLPRGQSSCPLCTVMPDPVNQTQSPSPLLGRQKLQGCDVPRLRAMLQHWQRLEQQPLSTLSASCRQCRAPAPRPPAAAPGAAPAAAPGTPAATGSSPRRSGSAGTAAPSPPQRGLTGRRAGTLSSGWRVPSPPPLAVSLRAHLGTGPAPAEAPRGAGRRGRPGGCPARRPGSAPRGGAQAGWVARAWP